MSHLFIFNLRILCIYLLGYFVEYCSPAEDCDWSAWTEPDSDQFQHRAKDCDGKVEIESRNCNITTCSLSNGKNRTTENPPETTPIEHVDLPNHSGSSSSVKDTATLPTTKHHGNLSQNSTLPREETVGSNNHNRSISATTQINWHGKLDDNKGKTKLKNNTDSNSTTAKTMIISETKSDEKNQGKLETASVTEDVIVLRNVSPKGDFGYAACEQRKEQELNGFRYVKECLISVLALILVIAVTAHWCRRQKRSLDCLADEMSHQFVFQLLLVSLFLFGHYCSSADDCDWSTWTDLDSDNMQHRVKDFGNGSIQIISRHCKHRFYDIPNVTEHERQNKLPIVIYRCPKTAATPGLYHSYEPKIDLASDVPIETRETPEIPTVISNREISTWDKNPKLNQTKLIEMLKNIIIGALSLALIGVSTMLCIQCKKRTSVIKRDSCALSEMEFRSRQRSERTRSTTSSGYAIPKIRSIISSGDSTYNRLNECNYMNTSFMTESQSPSFIDAKMQVIFEKMANGHQENTGSMDSTSTSHSYINVVEGGGRSLLSDSLTSSGYTKPNQDIRKHLNDVLKKIPKSRGKVSR